jgi:CMP-N-acetylneuraminic acid synthetase/spore coat polysaccharide biosynthesis predicted glycosyltransferase SpsG
MNSLRTVAIVPARGGSEGIPRKNIRVLGSKPLVAHSIELAKSATAIDEVVLTTENREIKNIGRQFGVDRVVDRPEYLSENDVPLAPVIEHAADQVDPADAIVCLQPTVPLLSQESLDAGVEKFHSEPNESLIFVRKSTHIYWEGSGKEKTPLSDARENRQWMEPIYEEIGAFVSSPSLVSSGKRVGESPLFHNVPDIEGIDIDTYSDWVVAESQLKRQSVLYRVIGSAETGLGHVYRGITLADEITHHDLTFAVLKEDTLAKEILNQTKYPFIEFTDQTEFEAHVKSAAPDIVINDVLNTSGTYIKTLKRHAGTVVNFEDLGEGTRHADIVINALYEHSSPPKGHYYGSDYFCLRSEFRFAEKKTGIGPVDTVMVSFGGTDKNDLTSRSVEAVSGLDPIPDLDIVLGPGYSSRDALERQLDDLPESVDVTLSQDVSWMSKHMLDADLLVTSNGRTIYEAASLNLPCISISQNQQEQRHPFAHLSNGILDLGLAPYVSVEDLRQAISDYISDADMRNQMHAALRSEDIENGIGRITDLLFEEPR